MEKNIELYHNATKNTYKIGMVTIPISKASVTPLLNLIEILSCFSDKIFIITGNEFAKIRLHDKKVSAELVYYNYDARSISKIVELISLQLKYLFKLLKIARKVDFFIFFIGNILVLPIFASKVSKKKVVMLLAGSSSKAARYRESPFSKLLYIIERINFLLANRIIVYSQNLIKEWNLEKYKQKIIIAHEHFVDLQEFDTKRKFDERPNLVGFIGRVSAEKGVLNLILAVPLVLSKRRDTCFLICGNGELSNKIKETIKNEKLKPYVKVTEWIPHEEIPLRLNELKLLVLPSSTEGLPNIMLEAMACGTPVLATPVGAIPDIIKDGETGFLLKSNNPKHIADKIIELLNKPELLEKVSKNAYNYVREKFSYEKTLKSWRRILSGTQKDQVI